ncbi:MAG: SCO family protein [Proteobacteria bacterium]|nr:SCO family protein [Pseudomonadota bacterium]
MGLSAMKNSFIHTNRYLLLALVIVFTVGGFVQFYFDKDGIFQRMLTNREFMPNTSAETGSGTPKIGGDYILVDQTGKPFGSENLKGKYALINFGYASCPDICIENLTTMSEAYDDLPQGLKDKLQLVFITIDPERDTPEKLAAYLPAFHQGIIGLTGTSEQIADVAGKFLVYRAKRSTDEKAGSYLMDHSAFFYLMGPDGKYVMHYRHKTDPLDMSRQIAGAVAEHS